MAGRGGRHACAGGRPGRYVDPVPDCLWAWARGHAGWGFVTGSAIGPLVTISILVALTAVIEVSALGARGTHVRHGRRCDSRGGSGNCDLCGDPACGRQGAGAALVGLPVVWWCNFGWTAALCTGAVLAYDYRVRSARRAAVLRKVRLQAAGVIRRTAEVRLQAMQARIDPRFLFDALAAVERDSRCRCCRG